MVTFAMISPTGKRTCTVGIMQRGGRSDKVPRLVRKQRNAFLSPSAVVTLLLTHTMIAVTTIMVATGETARVEVVTDGVQLPVLAVAVLVVAVLAVAVLAGTVLAAVCVCVTFHSVLIMIHVA